MDFRTAFWLNNGIPFGDFSQPLGHTSTPTIPIKLCPYVYPRVPKEEIDFFHDFCRNNNYPTWLTTIARQVSSSWSTGLSWLSTEDGITMGFCRFTGRRLSEVLGTEISVDTTNTGRLNTDPKFLLAMVNKTRDRRHWTRQCHRAIKHWVRIIQRFNLKNARAITLAIRADNSAPLFLSEWDGKYESLVKRYSQRGRGPSRIRKIEAAIPADQNWYRIPSL